MRHQRRLVSFVLAGVIVVAGLTIGGAEVVRGQTADTVKGPIHDPDIDLPFAERDAKYRADWDAFTRRLALWMADLDPSSLDLASLEHAENWALTDSSKPTLDEAVASADRIVVGRAKELHPDGSNMMGTKVTFEVERTLKGKSGNRITVEQGSTFYPTPDWDGVQIVDRPGEPLMFPGHRYVLLLNDDPRFGLYVQLFSGWYELKDGTVHALGGNEFGSEVDRLLERDFVRVLEASVRRTSGQ